jgi:hypothetical protein
MTEEDDLENEEKEMEISLFKPAGPEIEKVIEELQMKKMSLSQAREVATRMVYGIMESAVESQTYIDSIYNHAQTEESGTRVMSRVRKIKRENLH